MHSGLACDTVDKLLSLPIRWSVGPQTAVERTSRDRTSNDCAMFVSVRYNEVEAGCHRYHCGQYLQQQCSTANDWTSSAYNHRQRFAYSTPLSTSTYLDNCNAVCSWDQLNDTAGTLPTHGSWNPQTTLPSCAFRSSLSCARWTNSVNSTCYDSARSVYDYQRLSDVRQVAETAVSWNVEDELNARRAAELASVRTLTTAYRPEVGN